MKFTEHGDATKGRHEQRSFSDDGKKNSQSNKPIGHEKPVHNMLGGGTRMNLITNVMTKQSKKLDQPNPKRRFTLNVSAADVLLWRNKKNSAGVLVGATAVWVFFEWLNYHLLSITCFALIFSMLAQFLWANAGIVCWDPSRIPRLQLPEQLFVHVAKTAAVEVNRALAYLQDVSCGGDKKHFLMAVGFLFSAAIMGSCFSFLTVLYIGFIAAHTLPILYERYETQVDEFMSNVSGQLQSRCGEVLSKIPKGQHHERKTE